MNQIAENSVDSHWKRKRVYSIIRVERKHFLLWRKNQLKDFFVAILFIMEEILYFSIFPLLLMQRRIPFELIYKLERLNIEIPS